MSQVPATALPKVRLVIPCLNEVKQLEWSVESCRKFLQEHFPYRWEVFVADNGSKDGTAQIAEKLVARWPGEVALLTLTERGRGRALRRAWTQSAADIVAYTDVDISTELAALEKLCRAIHEDGYDVATGSRLMKQSQVKRGPKREIISRLYNLFIKLVLFTRFSDAQCGFKAASRRAVEDLVPQIKDQGWFFDT